MKHFLFFFLFVAFYSTGQTYPIPKKASKIIGEWHYKSGAGLEIWEKNGGELKGREIRINKLGDSIVVEHMEIHCVNNQLVYVIDEHKSKNDSIFHHKATHFVSRNKKMNFNNIDSNVPVSISYHVVFFNRKKVRIKIQFSPNEKPVKLLMVKK